MPLGQRGWAGERSLDCLAPPTPPCPPLLAPSLPLQSHRSTELRPAGCGLLHAASQLTACRRRNARSACRRIQAADLPFDVMRHVVQDAEEFTPPGPQGMWGYEPVAAADRNVTLAEMLAAGAVCRSWRRAMDSATGEQEEGRRSMRKGVAACHGCLNDIRQALISKAWVCERRACGHVHGRAASPCCSCSGQPDHWGRCAAGQACMAGSRPPRRPPPAHLLLGCQPGGAGDAGLPAGRGEAGSDGVRVAWHCWKVSRHGRLLVDCARVREV